jgi:hypothetical protein
MPTGNGTKPRSNGLEHSADDVLSPSLSAGTLADLAIWLLAREIGADVSSLGLAAAAERVCEKLANRLSRLVSPAGPRAILARALHISRARFPFLANVRAGMVPGPCLEGLREQIQDVDPGAARQGLLAVLETLLELLVGFIGEDLTLRLVGEVWAEVPFRHLSLPGDSGGQAAAT